MNCTVSGAVPEVGLALKLATGATAAAVAVMMDGTPHHIISIEPAASGAWVQSGRLAHHGSHLAR